MRDSVQLSACAGDEHDDDNLRINRREHYQHEHFKWLGHITTYTPGSDYIMFRAEASTEPVKYYYSKSTTVVDPEGKTVELSALRLNMSVSYTYTRDGGRMIITKITLTKPLSYYEKETTTTTTTRP